MTVAVADETLGKIAREQYELFRRVEGRFFSQNSFKRDMSKEGWTLLQDVSEPEISVAFLELVPFLREGEQSIIGEVMTERSKELGANLGQRHAEYLLEHQEEIPQEWRSFYISFPGTIWRDPHGYRDIPCLRWSDGGWDLLFRWLGDRWRSDGRLVRPRK